ncbi:MAG: hypothetical protein JXA89_09480 [Anaerolineae bacterium]|nr:hypothetical protein [Anaerolineae bacterium]
MHSLLQKRHGGDLRSIDRADRVVVNVLENSPLLDIVFENILIDGALVRMCCVDAAEKVTAHHHDYLYPHITRLFTLPVQIEQPGSPVVQNRGASCWSGWKRLRNGAVNELFALPPGCR